jgi:hypothetical protein
MKPFKALFVLAILALTALVGCGSSGPSEEDLKTVVLDYSAAVQDGNWEEVCSLISSDSQKSVVDNSGQLSCTKGYQALSKKDQEILSASAKDATFVSSKVDGDKATVSIKTLGGTAKVPAIVEDGTWKVHLFK